MRAAKTELPHVLQGVSLSLSFRPSDETQYKESGAEYREGYVFVRCSGLLASL